MQVVDLGHQPIQNISCELGLLNAQMDQQWREEADTLMVWDIYLIRDGQDFVNQSTYKAVPFDMGELAQCEDFLLVFQKR